MHHSVTFHCTVEKKEKIPHDHSRKGKQLFKHTLRICFPLYYFSVCCFYLSIERCKYNLTVNIVMCVKSNS